MSIIQNIVGSKVTKFESFNTAVEGYFDGTGGNNLTFTDVNEIKLAMTLKLNY